VINLFKKYGFNGSINTLSFGLKKHLISPMHILNDSFAQEFLLKLDDEQLFELNESQADLDKFINLLKDLNDKLYDEQVVSDIWAYIVLAEIVGEKSSEREKLDVIAEMWAVFSYRNDWKEFINYMPAADPLETGINVLYRNVLMYLEKEKGRLQSLKV